MMQPQLLSLAEHILRLSQRLHYLSMRHIALHAPLRSLQPMSGSGLVTQERC